MAFVIVDDGGSDGGGCSACCVEGEGAPTGVNAVALGLNGLNELALALNLNADLLAEAEIGKAWAAAAAAAASFTFARAFSALKGGIFGIVIFASMAFVSASGIVSPGVLTAAAAVVVVDIDCISAAPPLGLAATEIDPSVLFESFDDCF